MAIKILTKNSIDNTNIDGARANHFSAGMRSGIVKGAFNEGNFFASVSNEIVLDSCELRISGHQVIIDSAETITFNDKPLVVERKSMIAEISVDDNSVPTFRLFIQNSDVALIQDNLFKMNNGRGTYQLRIGNFTLEPSGVINDVVRTADLITGGFGSGSNSNINIGNVVTNTLEPGVDAEVDIEERYDELQEKTFTDFTFSIPKGQTGMQGKRGYGIYFASIDTEESTTYIPNGAFSNMPEVGDYALTQNGYLYHIKGITYITGGEAIGFMVSYLASLKGEQGKVGATFSYDEQTKTLNIITE